MSGKPQACSIHAANFHHSGEFTRTSNRMILGNVHIMKSRDRHERCQQKLYKYVCTKRKTFLPRHGEYEITAEVNYLRHVCVKVSKRKQCANPARHAVYVRIAESRLEKTCKIIKSNREPSIALFHQGFPQTL